MLITMLRKFIKWFKSVCEADTMNVGCARKRNGEHE